MTTGTGLGEAPGARRSRLRLIVVQALVLALFGTLLARLWFLQVADGETYQAQAASQSIRDIVVQPARGLIVDAQGRPLVANRTSWTVSVDRTTLGRLDADVADDVLERTAALLGVERATVDASLLNCGDADAVEGSCWNGSPYQPVPVALDVDRAVALQIAEQPEDFPAIVAGEETLRSYPSPYGVNAAHLLGYLSPVTESELDAAQTADDLSLNGASVVGRAGVEQAYDAWLRGMPGYQRVAVDSMGRVIGDADGIEATPGDTLVTSIDAQVQAIVEQQLAATIENARATRDEVTGRNYVADSGAVVVLEADTGRVVAAASQPTYDPGIWTGGISQADLDYLYSSEAGTPLLARATQGQFAPGSTWKPFVTAAALTHGYDTDTRLDCSSAFRVGNRDFRNYESGAYGSISFAKALEVSCNTFFYRIGYDYWAEYGSDVGDVDAYDPLVEQAQEFGFGQATGIDLPGEAPGRIADRAWKQEYYEAQKDYYCAIGEEEGNDFQHRFAREFCAEGFAYRAGDAVNFSIGQGDTIVTPLQLATAYGALANGGSLYEPTVAKAIVGPDGGVVRTIEPTVSSTVDLPPEVYAYIDDALSGVTSEGTMAWRMGGFPLDAVNIRSKTGSAEVYGKQSTSWVASYSDDYVVVMMVSQGGTGSGTSGPAIRAIWDSLYGVSEETADFANAAIPGIVAPDALPTFTDDGSILPPARDPAETES